MNYWLITRSAQSDFYTITSAERGMSYTAAEREVARVNQFIKDYNALASAAAAYLAALDTCHKRYDAISQQDNDREEKELGAALDRAEAALRIAVSWKPGDKPAHEAMLINADLFAACWHAHIALGAIPFQRGVLGDSAYEVLETAISKIGPPPATDEPEDAAQPA